MSSFSPRPISTEPTQPSISLTISDLADGEQARFLARSAGASFSNILVTFPINKLIFRQQAEGLDLMHAMNSLQSDGMSRLYRGVLPPLLQKSVSISIMFGIYEMVSVRLQRSNVTPAVAKINAALIAGSAEALLAPFERVQVLLQSRKFTPFLLSTPFAFRVLGQLGIKEYYRGWSAVLLRNGPSNVCFFGLREQLEKLQDRNELSSSKFIFNFVNGALLGAFISTLFLPLNTVRISMQDRIGGSFANLLWHTKSIIRERGVFSLYRGVYINAFRSCLSWGIINSSYEWFKKVI